MINHVFGCQVSGGINSWGVINYHEVLLSLQFENINTKFRPWLIWDWMWHQRFLLVSSWICVAGYTRWTISWIWDAIPGQYKMSFARLKVFAIPWWGLWISFKISGCMAFGIMIFSPLKRTPLLNDQYGKNWVGTSDLWSGQPFWVILINCRKSESNWVIDWSWSSLGFDISSVNATFNSNSNDVWLSDRSGK